MDTCDKTITGYLTKTTPIPNHIPYGSKYFGMAFIPEGEQWPVCPNCQREMILILQLLISDLPEAQEDFNEGDMLQVFTCAYIDPLSDHEWSDDNWNDHTNKTKVKDNQRCFNWLSKEAADEQRLMLTGSNAAEYHRLQTENWEFFGEPHLTKYPSARVALNKVAYPLRFTPRVINIKNKQPTIYSSLPWVDAYHLSLSEDGMLTDRLKSMQVNAEIIDYIYWIKSRLHFFKYYLTNPEHSIKITDWEQYSYQCQQSSQAHKIFNGCFESEVEEKLPTDFYGLGFLGALTVGVSSIIEREDIGIYPNCECCDKPMMLFFSFGISWGPKHGWASAEPVQGLFYCKETGDFQVSCIDERKA